MDGWVSPKPRRGDLHPLRGFQNRRTPTAGEATDLNSLADYGNQGVLALLSDSTNVERDGYTLSEREIGHTLENLIREAEGRVMVAVFASQYLPPPAGCGYRRAKQGRKVVFHGRSMVTNAGSPGSWVISTLPGTGNDLGRVAKVADPGDH